MKIKSLTTCTFAFVFGVAGISCQRSQNVRAAGDDSSSATSENAKAPNTSDTLLTPADRSFMKRAEETDIKERNLGRELIQRSQNSDTRDYAKMLVDDNTNDLHRIVDLMENKGIHQPKDLPEIKHEALAKLSTMTGTDLDRAFLDTMIADHQQQLAQYTRETQQGEDPAVRDYAAHAVEMLQKHLNKAQELRNKVDTK